MGVLDLPIEGRFRQALTFYKPEDYGAVGDGSTDDRAPIQAAIDAAHGAGGGIVWISKRYGWRGTLIQRGGVIVWGTGVRRVLVTDDNLDRGLVSLDNTSVYQYGAWGGGNSENDNPGPIANLNITGANVGGTGLGLFQMQCVDGAIVDVRITDSAGHAVEVGGSQNSSFERCVIGYSAGRAISFYQAGGFGAGQVKFNNCYISDADVLLYMDGDPAQYFAHDITFDKCLFELHVGGNDVADIRAGDVRFKGCVLTNSNSGLLPLDTLVKVSQDTYPSYATTVVFDGCWFNGGANVDKPTSAVLVKSAAGGVGNIVRFSGQTNVTNCDSLVGVEGATIASDIAVTGTQYLGGGVSMYSTAPGGSLFGVMQVLRAPIRFSMPDDPTGGLHSPLMFRRGGDAQDRASVDRDGTHYWFDGANTTVRGSLARNVTDNAMELGGTWRVQNAVAYRGIVVAVVTTSGQAVALSGASTSAPLQIMQFTVTGASANVTISGGGLGGQVQLLLDATTLTSGQTASITWPSNIKFATTAPQPVQGQGITVSLVQYGSNWYEIARTTLASASSGVTSVNGNTGAVTVEPTIAAGTTSEYWRGDKSWQTLDKTAVGLSNVSNVAQQPAFIAGTTATAISTAAKTATISGYTAAAGDVLLLTITNGNTATAPTLNINGAGAVAIYAAGAVADVNQMFTGANGIWMLRYSGSRWDLLAPVFDYTTASTAEMQAGVANSTRWMTSALVAAAIKAQTAILPATTQTANYTLALTDAGQLVEMNAAAGVTVTVPANASVAFAVGAVLEIHQYGAGQVTIAPAAGVTIRTPSSYTTRAQYSTIRLRKRATDEWVLSGDAT